MLNYLSTTEPHLAESSLDLLEEFELSRKYEAMNYLNKNSGDELSAQYILTLNSLACSVLVPECDGYYLD